LCIIQTDPPLLYHAPKTLGDVVEVHEVHAEGAFFGTPQEVHMITALHGEVDVEAL
jgi:hypothetical protein